MPPKRPGSTISSPSSSKLVSNQYASTSYSYEEDDSFHYGSDENEEEAEEDEGEEEDLDDDVDSDGDDMDGVILTPTKRASRRKGASVVREDSESSSLFGSPGRSKRGTPRKRNTGTPSMKRKTFIEMALDPTTPGWVKPNAADAYFLAASRPKRRKVDAEIHRDEEVVETSGRTGMIGAHSHKAPGITRSERQLALSNHYRSLYSTWQAELLAGFNLIFLGYGSKRTLLHSLLSHLSPLGHCVTVDGLYPGLGIREVLGEIERAFPDVVDCPVPAEGVVGVLEKAAHRVYAHFLPASALPDGTVFPTSNKPLFLLLHNIDSPGLRNPKSLNILSLLASCPRIHLITSFDHANSPILFPTSLSNSLPHSYPAKSWTGAPRPERGFCWAWQETPTYAPYTIEAGYAAQVASGKGGGNGTQITEEGTLRLLLSIPPHARRLFKLLSTRQLASDPPHIGVTFAPSTAPAFAVDRDLLHQQAKQRMFAVEETRFESFLGEWKDHGLVVDFVGDKEGEASGKGRWVWICLGRDELERVVKTMGEDEI